MNALIVGSGAREHAIAWKLRQSKRLNDLFAAPGNPGTASVGHNLDVGVLDIDALVQASREHNIDLVIVGNEEPLAGGLVDRLAVEGIAVFGPTRAAAEIEWSKTFAKGLMTRHGIPTAPFAAFDSYDTARAYVAERDSALAIKADGLTLGKGVVVASSREEALAALDAAMTRRVFGAAGARVVIEERMTGREVSAHAFTDGKTARHMPFSCDHKPVYDGDIGPNTGGMGAYSPPDWLAESVANAIRSTITEAAMSALASEERPYCGVLYPGVMVTDTGPRVVEFNSRFGDPEAQVLLPRLVSDLLEICWAAANKSLHQLDAHWSDRACVGVVLASGGYPASYQKGFLISGLDDLDDGVLAFQAGVKRDDAGRPVTAGGRVVTIVATGETLDEARALVYRNVERISFNGMHYRRDIGANAAAPLAAGAGSV